MKKVVITGAGSGMGLALVKHYLNQGYQVFATKLVSQKTPVTSKALTWQDIDFLTGDLTSWLNQIPDDIELFIANAGKGSYEVNTPVLYDDDLYRLNVVTPSTMFHYLKDKGFKGTFVVMGSIMAVWPLPGYARYSQTKAALVNYFKSLQMTETVPIVILLPVAVKTEFFNESNQPHAPWLAQDADKVALKMMKVIAKKKKIWISSKLFSISYLMAPWALKFYLKREQKLYHKKFIEGASHD